MELAQNRGRIEAVGLTAGAVCLTWWMSRTVVGGSSLPVLAVLVAALALAMLLRPRAAALVLLGLAATILPEQFGRFAFGGARSDVVEALSFLLVAVWLFCLARSAAARPRYLGPLLLIQLGLVVGLFVGAARGADQGQLLGPGKAFALYLLPLVFSSLFATVAQQDLLERWLLRFATLGSVATVLAATTGLRLNRGNRTNVVETLGTSFDAQRIRTPVLALVTIAILLVAGRVMDRGVSRREVVALLLYGSTIVLSFNRSTWVPLALAVGLLALLRKGPRVPGRGTAVLLLGSLSLAFLLSLAGSGAIGQTPQAAVQRLVSVTNLSVTSENSYQDRRSENQDAKAALLKDPAFGVGVSRPYGARRAYYFDDPPRLVYADRLYIHNAFLGAWLQLGLLGLAGFLLLGVGVRNQIATARRDEPPERSTRNIAAGLAVLVFALEGLLQTSLLYRPAILALAVAVALAQCPSDAARRVS